LAPTARRRLRYRRYPSKPVYGQNTVGIRGTRPCTATSHPFRPEVPLSDVIPVTIVPKTLDSSKVARHTARPPPSRAPKAPLRETPPAKKQPAKSEVSPMLASFEKATRILAVSDDILSETEKLARVQALLAEFKDVLFPAPVVVEAPPAKKERKPRVKVTDPVKLEAMRAVAAKARAARMQKLAAAKAQ
jgi:hypothetical protein